MSVESLQLAEDSLQSKHGLVWGLLRKPHHLLPFYILSHSRAGRVATLDAAPRLREWATLVVAVEEEAEYREAYPDVDLVTIPSGYAGRKIGIGRARQYLIERATLLGESRIIMADDDLTGWSVLFQDEGRTSGRVKSVLPEGRTTQDFNFGAILLFSRIAEDAMESDERVVLAAPRMRLGSFQTAEDSATRWVTNNGGLPMQVVAYDVDRFNTLVPEGFDLENFNYHGEDLYAAMEVLRQGGSVARIPSILVNAFDASDSVIRTDPQQGARLVQSEYDAVIRTGLDQWCFSSRQKLTGIHLGWRPDWRKMSKLRDLNRVTRMWDEVDNSRAPHHATA